MNQVRGWLGANHSSGEESNFTKDPSRLHGTCGISKESGCQAGIDFIPQAMSGEAQCLGEFRRRGQSSAFVRLDYESLNTLSFQLFSGQCSVAALTGAASEFIARDMVEAQNLIPFV